MGKSKTPPEDIKKVRRFSPAARQFFDPRLLGRVSARERLTMIVPVVSNRWGRMAFRLPALIALFAALAGLVAGGISYYVASDSYVKQTMDRMDIVRNERSRALLALMHEYRVGLGSLV